MTPQLSIELAVDESSHVGHARRTAVSLASQAGCAETTVNKVAIIVSELATNLARHATRGTLVLRALAAAEGPGIEIISIDRGPGIANVQQCLSDGFSTSGTSGTGLGAVSRMSSTWDIFSQLGSGTVIVARIHETDPSDTEPRIAGLSIALGGESECGDAWQVARDGSRFCLLIADGLGHGPLAASAAREAIGTLSTWPRSSPAEIVKEAHQRLRATRGAAVSVAEVDTASRTVRYAGVGNIVAQVVGGPKSQNLVSLNGTVGAQLPTVREFTYAVPPQSCLILHTDGLTSQVRLDGYPGLGLHDPAVIAGALYRDFKRGRDDATCVVAALQ